VLAGALPIVLVIVGVGIAAPDAYGDRPVTRAPAERAIGGITAQEHAAQQVALRTALKAVLQPAALNARVRVGITPQEQADLEAPPSRGAPLRIGLVKAVTPAVNVVGGQGLNRGTIQENADGSMVWALTITSPDAQAIRAHFTDFSLPPDAEMYFYSLSGAAHGPYIGQGRNGTGEFWTRAISAESGVIQLHFAPADRGQISFTLADVGHISGRPPRPVYRSSHDDWPCSDNVACLVDANCGSVGPAEAAKDAVAKIEWIQNPYIYTCTGGLIADTDGSSQIPYFLTANHCENKSRSNMEFYFHFSTDSCNGACPDDYWSPDPVPPSAMGATIVATSSDGDFSLFTMDETPPGDTTYLGWNNSPIAYTDGASLYRISNANYGPQVYSQHDVDANTDTCQGWPRGERIYSKDITGATMGGSSGSPVLNSSGEIVGQLSGCCGFNCGDECDSQDNWTVDGALAYYWDSVSEYLDPDGGCTGDPECDDGLFCTGTETCVGGSCQSSGDPCSGGDVCNEATDTCDAPACDNDGACEAGEDCNNCPNDCREKTTGAPSGRYCCDGDLPDCGNTGCNESPWSCGGGGGCTSDPECDDGQWCNGAETCVGGSCQGGSDPCPGQDCDEGSDQCVTCGQPGDPCASKADCCGSCNKKTGLCR
jgi:hypothetical protein